MRRAMWGAWKRMGGLLHEGEPFVKFFLRAASSIRLAMSSVSGDGLAGMVRETFGRLDDLAWLKKFNAPLREGKGQSAQQVFPLPPWSHRGSVVSRPLGRGDNEVAMHTGCNLLVAVLNWMHGGGGHVAHVMWIICLQLISEFMPGWHGLCRLW